MEELNQNNVAMNGSSGEGDHRDMPVIRTPDDSDVEMESQDEVSLRTNNGTCNGRNGSSNGYQNGNGHGYENEEDDMGKLIDYVH